MLEKAAVTVMDHLEIPDKDLPEALKDKVVAKGAKGKSGALVLRKFSGVENNTPKQLVKMFEANTGGRDDVIEKLAAADGDGSLKESDKVLLGLLRSASRSKGLARLMIEAKTEPLSVMKAYARGCVVLGQVQAAIEAHSRLPALVKDVFRHALDQEEVCSTCVGSGVVAAHQRAEPQAVAMESKTCPGCAGSGSKLVASKHKEFATKAALEITGQIKGASGPTVNVQTNIVNAPATGFMENLLKVSEKIMYGRPDIVEAEVVQP
jgi:hypothetical protein